MIIPQLTNQKTYHMNKIKEVRFKNNGEPVCKIMKKDGKKEIYTGKAAIFKMRKINEEANH